MEFQEYPKRVYKGDESVIANTVEEEKEFLGVKAGEIGEGQKSEQDQPVKETSEGETCGGGNVQTHEGQESLVGVLKRKAGRPKKIV